MNWRAVLSFLRSWQWLIAAIAAGVPIIYYGPRKVLETWDWYVDRFRDQSIMDAIRNRKLLPPEHNLLLQQHGPSLPPTLNMLILKDGIYTVGDLANILNRSRRSIGKSSRRLSAQGKVELYQGGFRLRENLQEKK